MKRITILLAVCVFFCLTTNAFSGEAIEPDKIKAILLKPNGWIPILTDINLKGQSLI